MMLEDLYVRPSERKRGVGHRLFNAVAKVSTFYNCTGNSMPHVALLYEEVAQLWILFLLLLGF